MSRGYEAAVRKVMLFAGIAAAIKLVEAGLDAVEYAKAGEAAPKFVLLGLAVVLALVIPCCGYVGAQQGNTFCIGCFSCWSYTAGVMDCVLMIFLVMFGVLFASVRSVANDCKMHTGGENVGDFGSKCDEKSQKTLQEFCLQFDTYFKAHAGNVTANIDKTQVSEMLNREHCIDTLSSVSTTLFFVLILVMILKCCAMCFHCASGYYGCQLYKKTQEGDDEASCSESEGGYA